MEFLNRAAIPMALFVLLLPLAALGQATPLTKEAMEYPREAVKAGIEAGEVKVRVVVDAAGNVVDVQILESRPQRVFDRVVRTTMAKWKFDAGADKRTYETIIEFKR